MSSRVSAGEPVEPRVISTVTPLAPRKAWWRSGLASTAVDEALLSALSLGLSLLLIRGASKEEYGMFALVNGVILLLRGVQNALVLTPLTTMGGRLRAGERASFVRTLSWLQGAFGWILAALVTAGVWIFAGNGGWSLAAGSGLALAGAWLREYRRASSLLDGKSGTALAGDVLFALVAAVTVLVLWLLSGGLSASSVLAVSGIGAGVAAFLGFPVPGGAAPAAQHRRVARLALDQGKWTLPGMAVTWAQNSGYAYAIGLLLGSAAVGEIAAARLFIVPLGLLLVAWNRVFLPRAAALLANNDESALLAQCHRSFRLALAGAALYVLVLAAAFGLGVGRILPPAYEGFETQVMAWTGFAVINLIRSIATAALLARLEFRALFVISSAGSAVSILLVIALISPLGAIGAILGMTGGELLLALLSWRLLLARRAGGGRG